MWWNSLHGSVGIYDASPVGENTGSRWVKTLKASPRQPRALADLSGSGCALGRGHTDARSLPSPYRRILRQAVAIFNDAIATPVARQSDRSVAVLYRRALGKPPCRELGELAPGAQTRPTLPRPTAPPSTPPGRLPAESPRGPRASCASCPLFAFRAVCACG